LICFQNKAKTFQRKKKEKKEEKRKKNVRILDVDRTSISTSSFKNVIILICGYKLLFERLKKKKLPAL